MMSHFIELINYQIPKFLYCISTKRNEPNCVTLFTNVSFFYPLVEFLKRHSFIQINQLVDICVVDHLNQVRRFEFFYVFFSTVLSLRVFVRFFVREDESIPSISSLFNNALWCEREV